MVAAARRWVPRVDPRGSLNALLRANLWKETSVTIAAGKHLFPSRTQQLSPSAPMVLGWQRSGRVGHRRGLFLLPAKRAPVSTLVRIMESSARLGVVVASLDQLAARLHSGVPTRGIDASAV